MSSARRLSKFFFEDDQRPSTVERNVAPPAKLQKGGSRRSSQQHEAQPVPDNFAHFSNHASSSNASSRDGPLPSTYSSNALAPPQPSQYSAPGSRNASRPTTANSLSPAYNLESYDFAKEKGETKLKRKTFFGGRKTSKETTEPTPRAWISGQSEKSPYNLSRLVHAQRVPELWDETGNTLVYLFPRTSDKGPSFKVHSSIYSSSTALAQLAFGSAPGKSGSGHGQHPSLEVNTQRLSLGSSEDSPKAAHSSTSSRSYRAIDDFPDDDSRQYSLYLPITLSNDVAVQQTSARDERLSDDDVETLIGVRNLFAFLVGQSLLATERRKSIFSVFLKISDLLKAYDFTNLDGSTFGEVPSASFDKYVDELGLADVRTSREKTIEALVLGESMKSVLLYNESFTHAVGKYGDIHDVARSEGPAAKFNLVSKITRNRMERASIDLQNREHTINIRLADFDFPSIFAGVLGSKMSAERKVLDFEAWKDAFLGTRKQVISYYKQKFGSWPPKPSKKNTLETSGLNRLVLKALYNDFADLYDLWADRENLTTRSVDIASQQDASDIVQQPYAKILRSVCDEYDRSTPPVQPPIPFDLPIMPDLSMTRPDHKFLDDKQAAKARGKKLKDDEIAKILDASCNQDTLRSPTSRSPFIAAIRHWERKQAHGCNINELANLRAGMWIFLYAIIQALPLLVVDAPAVRFFRGVEYFLCSPPRSGVPWASGQGTAGRATKSWYGIAGGAGVVSLPSDLIEHGVEGVYRRSHCWLMAARWSGLAGVAGMDMPNAVQQDSQTFATPQMPPYIESPLLPPPQLAETAAGIAPVNYGPYGSRSASLPGTPGASRPGSRAASPARGRGARDSVFGLGLEALPLPANIVPEGIRDRTRSRPPSANPGTSNAGSMTFDDIIGSMDKKKKGKK